MFKPRHDRPKPLRRFGVSHPHVMVEVIRMVDEAGAGHG